jgi:hypothetical protein
MSVFSKLRGTMEQLFQIGGPTGSQLKNNVGALEGRNSADSGFAIVRGATPIAANDLATKAYVDAGAIATDGGVQTIRIPVALATVSSTTTIPANSVIQSTEINVGTPYSGGATISIGQTGSTALLQATTDNTPQSANLYGVEEDVSWGASPLAVLVTVSGAPAAGAAAVIVRYVQVPQT